MTRREVVEAEEATIIRPGDTLILRVSASTPEQLHALSDRIREQLPADIKLLMLAGVDQLMVYRP